ncbi:MAG: hypothetical protein HN443_00255 [Flavobacteriaceae bacterium]|jgi:hypothetical protein|nr:hypothetical protein [Flavobacteriaceae bacterium]
MGRTVGTPNKITTEVKEKLQTLVEGVVDTLDITEMTIDQKLKLLQITSQYILPRLKSVLTEQVKDEDLPQKMGAKDSSKKSNSA